MRTSVALSCGSISIVMTLLVACGGSNDSAPAAMSSADAGAVVMPDAGRALRPPVDAATPSDEGAGSDAQPDAFVDMSDAGAGSVDAGPVSIYPQLVSSGGPVLTAPHIVPIFFPGYDFTTQVTDFVDKLGATDYWKAATAEYGVGAPTAGTPVIVTTPAPAMITDMFIQAFLVDLASTGKLGTPDPQTIFAVFYPTTTVVTQGMDKSCVDFGAYHSNFEWGTVQYPYAVIPECTNFKTLQGIDMVTGAASHEFIEASTDPIPNNDPAFDREDDDHLAWMFFSVGGENGDMCAQNPSSFYKPMGFDYMVQRGWSNIAAAAGKDPCVPAIPSLPYFNAVPTFPDVVTLSFMDGFVAKTHGIAIDLGVTKTIELDLFSDGAPSAPWTIVATDENAKNGGAPILKFDFDKNGGLDGDKVHLTITVLQKGSNGIEPFLLTSTLGTQKAAWAGVVLSH